MTNGSNIVDTIRALFHDGTTLVRQEVNLAKAEAEEKLEQVQHGLIEVFGAMIIAMAALFVLVQALVEALEVFMPDALAALLVGLVLAVIAYIAFRAGMASLSPSNLTPRRTIESVREDVETIKEAG